MRSTMMLAALIGTARRHRRGRDRPRARAPRAARPTRCGPPRARREGSRRARSPSAPGAIVHFRNVDRARHSAIQDAIIGKPAFTSGRPTRGAFSFKAAPQGRHVLLHLRGPRVHEGHAGRQAVASTVSRAAISRGERWCRPRRSAPARSARRGCRAQPVHVVEQGACRSFAIRSRVHPRPASSRCAPYRGEDHDPSSRTRRAPWHRGDDTAHRRLSSAEAGDRDRVLALDDGARLPAGHRPPRVWRRAADHLLPRAPGQLQQGRGDVRAPAPARRTRAVAAPIISRRARGSASPESIVAAVWLAVTSSLSSERRDPGESRELLSDYRKIRDGP